VGHREAPKFLWKGHRLINLLLFIRFRLLLGGVLGEVLRITLQPEDRFDRTTISPTAYPAVEGVSLEVYGELLLVVCTVAALRVPAVEDYLFTFLPAVVSEDIFEGCEFSLSVHRRW